MKTPKKIELLTEGYRFKMPQIESKGNLYRVTDKAIQINCVNNGMLWIPKSTITYIDEITGEIELESWIVKKIQKISRTNSGAY